MPYLGQAPTKGDENNFKILDNISSYTLTFDGSDAAVVSAANDTITSLNHRFVQGQRVTYNKGGGDVIAGLSDGVYYIIKNDHNTIKLATSASNASNGTAVNITGVGNGSSHTLNVAFDGVNTKFKATHTNGQKAKITRSAQLVISINGVIQQPHDTATPSTGFGFDLDGTIVLSQAPASTDVYWAHVLTNNNVTFDISDNDVDNFTGNASTTAFNLSKSPPDNRNVLVTIDGVVQYPNDPDGTVRAYNVVENVLTFTTAPTAGAEIQVRHIGFAGSSSGSGSGGVTNFYGRTGSVVLKSTDNITVNDAAITGNATVTGNISAVDATFSGNLTVQGTTTTLDTVLTEVDKLEVAANNSTVGVAITQSGSGDILNLYDGSSEVFTVTDGGDVGIARSIFHLGDTNTDIGFPYNDAIIAKTGGVQTVLLNSSGALIEGRIKQNNTNNTVFPGLSGWSTYAYAPYPHELELDNNQRGTQGSFAGIYFVAGADSDGSKVGTARISAVETGNYNADLVFSTRNSSFTEKVRIKANGNVGIGTDNPSAALHLQKTSGTALVKLENTNGTTQLDIRHTNGYGAVHYVHQGTEKWRVGQTAQSDHFSIYQSTGAGSLPYRLFIQNNGEVGINTSDPTNTLHLLRNNVNHGITLQKAGTNPGTATINVTSFGALALTAANNFVVTSGGSQAILFNRGSTEVARFDTSGRLGIGTDTPTYPLQVHDSSAGGLLRLLSSHEGNYDLRFVYQNSEANVWSYASSDMTVGTRYARKLHLVTNGPSKRLTIDDGGRVGIGITNPSVRLHLKLTSRTSDFRITDSDTTADVLRAGAQPDGDGLLQLRTTGGSGPVLFDASGVSYITGGNFGVGTVSPTRSFHVKGMASGNSTNRMAIFESTGTAGSFIAFEDANTTDDSKCRIGSVGGNIIGIRGDAHRFQDGGGNNKLTIGDTGIFTFYNSAAAYNTLQRANAAHYIGLRIQETDGTQRMQFGVAGTINDIVSGSAQHDVVLKSYANLLLATNQTERLRIDSRGDVYLSESTALSSPYSTWNYLSIGNNLILSGYTGGNGGFAGMQHNAYVNSSGQWVRVNNDHATSIGTDDGNFYFRNTGAGTGTITWNNCLTILANGKTGINNINPTHPFHIVNTSSTFNSASLIKGDNSTSGQGAYATFTNTANSKSAYFGLDGNGLFNIDAGAALVGTSGSEPIIFATNGNDEKVRIFPGDDNVIQLKGGGNLSISDYAPYQTFSGTYGGFHHDNHGNTLIGLNAHLNYSGTSGTHQWKQTNAHPTIGSAGMFIGGNGSNNNTDICFFANSQGSSAGTTFAQDSWKFQISNSTIDITQNFNKRYLQRGFFKTDTSNQNATNFPNAAGSGVGGYSFGFQEAFSTTGGNWSHPYPDLILGYHTGTRFGSLQNYGGCRFYGDHPNFNTSIILSVGNGGGGVHVTNTFTAGSNKGFRIAHPHPSKKYTHDLVHNAIEAPQMDLIYRGKIDLVDGSATVNIDTKSNMTDGTFVLLNRDVQCFTSNETGWTAVKGSVSGNILTITAQDNSCTDTISWMVVGERQDDKIKSSELTTADGDLIVEPLTIEETHM